MNRWEEFDVYWIPRGWSKEGPIKTQSRIDVPLNGRTLKPGLRPIAGVAWAQDRGITKGEVQIGDGGWQETQLGEAISKNTWRQWVLPLGRNAGDATSSPFAPPTSPAKPKPPPSVHRTPTAPPAITRSWWRSADSQSSLTRAE